MANYKVAYGKRENMTLAIERGIIPPGCIILTEDSQELFFYDLNSRLTQYEEKYKFTSKLEAEQWVQEYNCKGRILSIHEEGKCQLYIVEYDNKLSKISGVDYLVSDQDPTVNDNNHSILTHWINADTENVFILVSIKGETAVWKSITDTPASPSSSYRFVQSIASDIWNIVHNLDKYPSVTIVDSAGNVVIGDVTYLNSNSLLVRFQGSFSGKAYLN